MEIKDKSGVVLIVVEGGTLQGANLRYADLQYANLQGADLQGANLQGADLRNADLDFSVLFFGCKSFDFKADKRIMVQIVYHFCRIITEDEEAKKAQKYLRELANQFHRVEECGKIK